MDRETLLQHCDIYTYEAKTCKVVHRGQLTNAFEARTGVKDPTVAFSVLAAS